ncbi:hypothetical protein SORBI_3001G121000 [Sorghum bicolor]|uniref:Uncharacterized protein n=1 Tax=Sorghum bicolor TaxID=4558 RepID=A0A1B6QIJ8_SORBI|nr:hypothetical protein SORBI_3001G121000 [Sorghum bicolor]
MAGGGGGGGGGGGVPYPAICSTVLHTRMVIAALPIIGLRRCMLGTHCIDDSDLAETTRERPQSWWPTTHHTCMQPPAYGCHCQSQHGASSDVW